MSIEKYTIESDNHLEIKLAINAHQMYDIIYNYKETLRTLWKYGKPEALSWESVIEDLYKDLHQDLYDLGLND